MNFINNFTNANYTEFENRIKSDVEPPNEIKKELGRDMYLSLDDLLEGRFSRNELSVAVYFTCLKVLSEAMGKLPIYLYKDTDTGAVKDRKHQVNRLMRTRPNPYMTPTFFISTMELFKNHYGNSYAYIERLQNGYVKNLWLMHPDDITLLFDDAGIFGRENSLWYEYNDPKTGFQYVFHSDSVIHFKTSMTNDGITGVSVRDKLRMLIDGEQAGQEFVTNLNQKGLTARAILQYTGDLNDSSREKLQKNLAKFASGAQNAGAIVPIPIGMQLSALNLKLTDSQFSDLRRASALQIAAAFGVKPNQLNDYKDTSFKSAEAQNLAFYTDTLLYLVKSNEEELTYKILDLDESEEGYHLQFDAEVILRTDQETLHKINQNNVQNGIKTPNEARAVINLQPLEHGDELVMNGNYIKLSQVGTQYGHINEE